MLIIVFSHHITLAQVAKKESKVKKKILSPVVVSGKNQLLVERTNVLHVQTLTRLELENRGVNSVREGLLLLPSITPYEHAGQDYIQFQGLSGQYLKITIDGIPTTGRISTSLPLNQLSFFHIDKIELFKGASTTLHGNNAIGGLINIVTKGSLNSSYNAYNKASIFLNNNYTFTGRYWANIGWQHNINSLLYTVQAAYTWDDGFSENEQIGRFLVPNYKLPNINKFDVSTSVLQRLEKNAWLIKGSFFQNNSSRSSEQTTIQGEQNTDRKADALFHWQNDFNKNVSLHTYTSYKYFQHDINLYSIFNQSEQTYQQQYYNDLEMNANLHYTLSRLFYLQTGVHYLLENAYLDSAGSTNRFRNNGSFFVHGRWSPFLASVHQKEILDNTNDSNNLLNQEKKVVDTNRQTNLINVLVVSTGVRATISDGFPATINPEIGVRYSPFNVFTWRLHYGRGYRSPTFKDQYYYWVHPLPVNFLITGNLNLKVEQTDSIQNSFHFYIAPLLTISLSGYGHWIRNKISYGEQKSGRGVIGGKSYNGIRKSENVSQAYSVGSDIELKGVSPFFRYQLSFAYNHSQEYLNQTIGFTDAELAIPYSAKIFVAFVIPAVKTLLGTTVQWHSSHLINRETEERLPDNYNVDFNFNQPLLFLGDNFSLYGGIKNILNHKTDFLNRQEGIKFHIGFRAALENL